MLLTSSVTIPQLALASSVLCIGYVLAAYFVYPLFAFGGKWWKSQEWIGMKKQWFSHFRAGLDTIRHTRGLVAEGYEKYTKKGKTWIIPQFVAEPLVVLSASQMNELLALPDDEVDPHAPNQESIATKYTIGNDVNDGPHIDVVRRQLTRRLPLLTPFVYEELVLSMQDNWQANHPEWTTVKAYPTCMKVVSRAANRVFAGAELCRTPEFLDSSRLYAQEVFKVGALMKMLPKPLHPIAGPILCRGVRKHLAICSKHALPIIRDRLKRIMNPVKDPNYKVPVDALQWMLEDCVELAKTDPHQLNESLLCRRLLLLNMVAIHTTSMVTTNTMLDLFSSPNKTEYLAGLREEVERVLRESGGEWSKNAINSMHRVDSTIRESMRYSNLGDLGMRREIIAPKGVTLRDGTYIPKGVRCVAPNHAIHTDAAFYGDNANEWDAFRFSRPREAYLAQVDTAGGDPDRLARVLEQKNQGLTATAPEFLSFGHGRHSCPGRFFASQEIKLMMAHVIMSYDIDIPGGKRPENSRIGAASFPSSTAEMRIKLRGPGMKIANGHA